MTEQFREERLENDKRLITDSERNRVKYLTRSHEILRETKVSINGSLMNYNNIAHHYDSNDMNKLQNTNRFSDRNDKDI